jgi:hypothetical protein
MSDSVFGLWFGALFFIVMILAEIFWEVPVHFLLVDFRDLSSFCLGKNMLWSNPENRSNVGPSTHVRAVNKNDVLLGGLKKIPGFIMG